MRVRFVGQNGGPRVFDSPWDMPLDIWTKSPKPEETGPQGWVSVKEIPGNPQVYSLEQNFPNPFNPSTKIRFSVPEQGLVTLKVFNLLGEEVATLINYELTTGTYEADFKGTEISSGIYFYTLTAENFISTKKMILLK
ncbi:MAG: T9SS type A sorting domain-containing protein [Ignavibacteriaceae bacterium]|nr:T9SS type A sorting domain-containing protein [Ignavibacteriaceae bacterium]